MRQPKFIDERQLNRVETFVVNDKLVETPAKADVKRLVLDNLLFVILAIVGCALVATSGRDDESYVALFGGVFFGAGFTPLVLNGWACIVGPFPKGFFLVVCMQLY